LNLTNQRRALIDWSLDRFESMIYPDVVTCIYPLAGFADAPADREAAGRKASDNLSKFAEVFLKEKFIGGPDLSIADYKVAPFFFAFAFKKTEEESKVVIPERILQFNQDFKAKVPETYQLLSDKEGMSIKELIDSKTGGPENNPVKEAKEPFKEDPAVANTSAVETGEKGEKGKVIIHGVTASMNCLGPLLLAKHTKVGSLKVCMPGEDSQSDEYKKIVPLGGVPGMEDGKWSMGESGAILRYLAREYAVELYPTGAEQRGRIDWAMDRFCSGMYNDCVATIYVAMGFADAPEKEADLQAAGKKASAGLADFAKVFLKDKFVGGDNLSIADFKIAPFFCAYAHQRVQRKCFVEVPERIMEFNLAFAEACEESKLFQKADGLSLVEILDAKEKAEQGKEQAEAATPELDTMQKAMAEEAQQTVVSSEDKVPIIDNASAPMCGCF
jgi:glutathione S-transferase